MGEKLGHIETDKTLAAPQLPVMSERDAFNIIATCRQSIFVHDADLKQLIALKAKRSDALPATVSGKVKKIIPHNAGFMITLKDFKGGTWDIHYQTFSSDIPFAVKDTVIFSGLHQEPSGFVEKLLGRKNTNPVTADNCGILITTVEREFLAANKQSHLVIARPLRSSDLGRETAVTCEPICGPSANIRYFNGSPGYIPSIGKPFIAAVTHSNGQQYIPVGIGRCLPLATDLTPHVFC